MRTLALALLLVPLAAAPASAPACPSQGDPETVRLVALPGVAVDRERRSYDTPECSSGTWRASASAQVDAGVVSGGASGTLVGVSWFQDRREGAPFDEHAAVETAVADVYWDQRCTGPATGWAGVGVAHPFGFFFHDEEALCALPPPAYTGDLATIVLP